MWQYEKEIKDAIRTLAKEFYRNPSGFTSKSDFKERFYRICSRKRAFKKKYKDFTLDKKLSVLRKDCPIYFAKKKNDKIREWSYDIAVLSPDLITRFDFKNSWHMSLLKNDAVGLTAAIEFLFITEHSDKIQREVEDCYARMDTAHHLAGKYIVAFSNSRKGNDAYFERTINDPGSSLEPDIVCISLEEGNGKKNMKWEQYPLPWITISKFKDRMERLDFYMWEKFWSKYDDLKDRRLEKRYQIIDVIKKNRVVGLTGHAAVDRQFFATHIQRCFSENDMFGNRLQWLNFGLCEENSFDFRGKEKGLAIFDDVCDEKKLRSVLEYVGDWHVLITSRTPIAQDIVETWIDIGGRKKKPRFIAKYFSGYLFGESKW